MTCPWPNVWTSLETMKGTMKDLSFALALASIVFMGYAPPHSTRDTVGDCIRNCRHEHLICSGSGSTTKGGCDRAACSAICDGKLEEYSRRCFQWKDALENER